MSECKFNLCDGSGETVELANTIASAAIAFVPCECAKRDAVPMPTPKPPEMTCSFWGCNGCPACIPGYVP